MQNPNFNKRAFNELEKDHKRISRGIQAQQRIIDEQAATIAMLSQQLADKKEIIRRLTTWFLQR